MHRDKVDQVAELEREWDRLLRDEDIRWRQRSKEIWAKKGDRNISHAGKL